MGKIAAFIFLTVGFVGQLKASDQSVFPPEQVISDALQKEYRVAQIKITEQPTLLKFDETRGLTIFTVQYQLSETDPRSKRHAVLAWSGVELYLSLIDIREITAIVWNSETRPSQLEFAVGTFYPVETAVTSKAKGMYRLYRISITKYDLTLGNSVAYPVKFFHSTSLAQSQIMELGPGGARHNVTFEMDWEKGYPKDMNFDFTAPVQNTADGCSYPFADGL